MALDENILDNISKKLELRRPNKEAVQAFLNYYYKSEKWFEYILSVATGVGKTYIIAAILNIYIYMYISLLTIYPYRVWFYWGKIIDQIQSTDGKRIIYHHLSKKIYKI